MSLWGLRFVIGHEQLILLVMGGGHRAIDKYKPLNYLSDFAENRLKGVYMGQDDTRKNNSQTDPPFKIYAQKSKCSIYVYH